VQTSEGTEAADGDGDRSRHARPDSRVEKDAPATHFANIDQRRLLIASAAPTEPQVTNVTSASTAGVAISDDKRVPVGVFLEPAPCLLIEYDGEFVHHAIMARQAGTRASLRLRDEGLMDGGDRRDLVVHHLESLRLGIARRDLL
jgi:hypothetical protein